MNIGIFIPNWVGDAVMCTPALRALCKHFGPTARLTGVLRPHIAEVLAGAPWLDETVFYDPKSSDLRHQPRAVRRRLQDARFDAVALFTNSFRSAALAWSSRAPVRAGFVRYARGPLLTHKLYAPRRGFRWLPTPAIDQYLQVAYALDCPWESPRLELATTDADEAMADVVWRKWQLPLGEKVVVFNTGGAYGAAKAWPNESFAQLARRLVLERNLAVLVGCGPNERNHARRIVELAGHPRVVSLADEPVSIGLTKACIRRSRMVVSTDSGPRFFALAFSRPVVSLFGPTDPAWTRTHSDLEIALQHRVPCGPCGKRTCPLAHHDCMRLLDVERVHRAVCAQLDGGQKQQAA